jgi:hypothetical protein
MNQTHDLKTGKFALCVLAALSFSTFAGEKNSVEKMEVFEFEFVDYYNPEAENAQSAIEAELKSLNIRGEYEKAIKKSTGIPTRAVVVVFHSVLICPDLKREQAIRYAEDRPQT